MELRVCVNPAGQILIGVGTAQRWADLDLEAWRDAELVNSLHATDKDSRKLIAPMMAYYKSLGYEIAWPRMTGQFRATCSASGRELAVGTVEEVAAACGMMKAAVFRSQLTIGRPQKSAQLGLRVVFEPLP